MRISLYSQSDKKITDAQYIVELLCQNSAKKGGRELTIEFWKLDEWKSFFALQSKYCNLLLNKGYFADAIIEVLKEGRIFSLRPKWVQDKIKVKHEQIRNIDVSAKKVVDSTTSTGREKTANKLEELYG